MKPGHKKKTPKLVIYLWNHKSFTETDSALTWNHLRFQKNCLILILRREIDLQVSKQTRLKIEDNSPLDFADTSFSRRQGKNTHVRGKSWYKLLKMALSQSRFRSKIGAKSTFLQYAKLPKVNRAKQGVVSGFTQMTWSGTVFTIIIGTKKRNNTFYQAWRFVLAS